MNNYPDNRIVKKRSLLNKSHYRTGNVRETINGLIQDYLPYKLEIIMYPDNNDGFYLISMNNQNEDINDTWHPTIEDALEQAFYEYNVQPVDWEDV